MNVKAFFISLILGLGMLPPASTAHHNWLAEFDPDLPVIVSGTVVNFQLTNPHARLYVDEIQENGELKHWNFELAAAAMLMRQNIKRDTLKPGDRVIIHAARAREVANVANVEYVVIMDEAGNEIFTFGSARQ
tara:strand:- start:1491 stop:1889 length:399 start_codon:yes stop_codon:yes gene_type:complete